MNERRSLIEGMQEKPTQEKTAAEQLDPHVVDSFIKGEKSKPESPGANSATPPQANARPISVPLTTRIDKHVSDALKRASFERRLAGEEPHMIQDIVQQALVPWLQDHGYLVE